MTTKILDSTGIKYIWKRIKKEISANITNTYSATSSSAMSGKAVASALSAAGVGSIIDATKLSGTIPSACYTWRGIQDNLASTSTEDSLSAAQGKVLNETKANLSGATFTGDITVPKIITASGLEIY